MEKTTEFFESCDSIQDEFYAFVASGMCRYKHKFRNDQIMTKEQ